VLDVLLGEQHRDVALQRSELADIAVVDVAELGDLHRPVQIFAI